MEEDNQREEDPQLTQQDSAKKDVNMKEYSKSVRKRMMVCFLKKEKDGKKV